MAKVINNAQLEDAGVIVIDRKAGTVTLHPPECPVSKAVSNAVRIRNAQEHPRAQWSGFGPGHWGDGCSKSKAK